MAVLVDTNVILDVVTDDPEWADHSLGLLEAHADEDLLINAPIYAELCFGYVSSGEVDGLIREFGLRYEEIPRNGLFRAAKAFVAYRRRGGTKHFVLPDFFIGGHADVCEYRLMTRDTGRYRTYFPEVDLIQPPR